MKGILAAVFTLFIGFVMCSAVGQFSEPVEWSVVSKQVDDHYEVRIKAKIEKGWHLYSQFMEMSDEGPLPTYVSFETDDAFELIGKAEESGIHVEKEPVFDNMEVAFFSNKGLFIQKVRVLGEDKILKGNVNFMVCNDRECMPPNDYSFQIDLGRGKEIEQKVEYKTDAKTLAIIPPVENVNLSSPVIPECGEREEESKSFWMIFLLGLGGGLVSLFTPCVFPMIPLTVSFFTKGGNEKGKGTFKAILYGFSIVLVYVALSLPFYAPGTDPEMLNKVAAGPVLNLIFFVVFLVFAFSFFGYYELTLPNSWANKADKAADMGGLVGVVFMALVLAIVSFSCTGPLLGSVLAGSLQDGPVPITMAMLGFGVGLGLPFTIFAAFPALLNSLPQSGGWLNSVKVVLGFVEVALAFKFFSTADLVEHWGIMKYEAFLVIWVVCSIGIAAYLMGWIKFPHDSPIKNIGIPRVSLAGLFMALAVYLSFGFKLDTKTGTFQSLSLLSGLAPPPNYSWTYPLECPNGLQCYHDYETALEESKNSGKPLLVDFTGHACTNCRRMEDQVWSQSEVFDIINEKYVLVSLYVDDLEQLPEELQGEVTIDLVDGSKKLKKINTIGDKWATFEQLKFGKVSQPYYALLSPNEVLLNNPVAYTPDVSEYVFWLSCGLDAMKKLEDGFQFEAKQDNSPVAVDIPEPVKWNHRVEKISKTEYEVVLHGKIDKGWHTYSQHMDMGEGPLPTLITFEQNDEVELLDSIVEIGTHTHYDETFKMDVTYFEDEVNFRQKIKLNKVDPANGKVVVKGNINYMVCENERCLPPTDAPFEIEINE